MPTGYKVLGGADLDTLFAPGAGGATTSYKVSGGADLNTVFMPYTTGVQVAATGYKMLGGADISTRFQNIAVPLSIFVNPTPGGTAFKIVIAPLTSQARIYLRDDGYIQYTNGVNYQLLPFCLNPAAGVAAGKYWRYVYASGALPNYTNMTSSLWYPCGSTYYVGLSQASGYLESYVTIQAANDASGTGATNAGTWYIYTESAF